MIGPVSAVLLNWRRQYHLKEICTHLTSFEQINEVIIVNNGSISPHDRSILRTWRIVRIMESGCNLCTLGRFYGATDAKYKTVLVADDDLLVYNIPALLNAYDGTRIVANLADDASSKHFQFWERDPKPYVELGFGSIFPRKWARQYLGMEWTDDQELRKRKSDKAFTCLFPWTYMRAGPEDITRLHHEGRESGKDSNALYKRTDHAEWTRRAVAAALQYKSTLSRHPLELPDKSSGV